MSCAACIHWSVDPEYRDDRANGFGKCRRYPPRIVEEQLRKHATFCRSAAAAPYDEGHIHMASIWPRTSGSDGCGEEQGHMPC